MIEPKEALDRALELSPRDGLNLSFRSTGDRERFRWRCYSAMSAEARASKKELEPTSTGWGKHPWGDLVISRHGLNLWITRRVDIKVKVVKNTPLGAED